ncbi:hypothetical protein GQ457_12G015040 [Hibiscus cannabinus]
MTRANPRGPIYNLDHEIERTQQDLKRRVRRLMEGNGNSGRQPADGQNLPAPSRWRNCSTHPVEQSTTACQDNS